VDEFLCGLDFSSDDFNGCWSFFGVEWDSIIGSEDFNSLGRWIIWSVP
jgi:hypothetical protein